MLPGTTPRSGYVFRLGGRSCEVTYFPPKRVVMGGAVIDHVSATNGLIYCDLIAPQFVGEDKVRVIQTIIVWPASGIHLYQNIYYIPVEKRVSRYLY